MPFAEVARVIWSPQALADLEAAGDFLARESPTYAQAFVNQAFAVADRLETFPRSGRIVPEIGNDDIRKLIFRGYRIMYIVSGPEGNEEAQILTVIHSSRQFG